jgi:hypothetical protein
MEDNYNSYQELFETEMLSEMQRLYRQPNESLVEISRKKLEAIKRSYSPMPSEVYEETEDDLYYTRRGYVRDVAAGFAVGAYAVVNRNFMAGIAGVSLLAFGVHRAKGYRDMTKSRYLDEDTLSEKSRKFLYTSFLLQSMGTSKQLKN